MHILRFSVADTSCAIAVDRVVEVAPRVLVTPLPETPAFIEGVFSYRQRACVAVSMRRRLGLPPRAPSLDEHIVVVRGRKRLLGLVVDRAEGDTRISDATVDASTTAVKLVAGVVPISDGVLLIHDVDALLTDADEHAVDASLAG